MATARIVVVLMLAIAGWIDPAGACSLMPPIEHQLDPQEQEVDTTPPGDVQMPTYSIGRGENNQMGCGATSCDDIGTLKLEIAAPGDDRTGPDEMGYRIEYLEGDMPEGLLPGYDVRTDEGVVYLYWSDDPNNNQEAFYFFLSIRAVDLAGNLSEIATELEVHHPGSCGCGSQRFGPTELMLLLAALALWCARRKI